MNILVGCEFSGIVRDAFIARGHCAVSCDLLPSESSDEGHHIQGDILDVIRQDQWDMLIAFPPCTDLAVSGAKWFIEKRADGRQQRALEFVRALLDAPIDRIAIENPVGVISTHIRKPNQYVQPWMFGHGETKKTGLWLKNLPLLQLTNIVEGREQRVWLMPPSPSRWKERSKTYQGIATAMAEQWGISGAVEGGHDG
jgi:site-specific DNA-cytosine methylase|tara:strand:- start:25 stop:618 length:594 start_codon:yes stop_codon:yes gene_type:complete